MEKPITKVNPPGGRNAARANQVPAGTTTGASHAPDVTSTSRWYWHCYLNFQCFVCCQEINKPYSIQLFFVSLVKFHLKQLNEFY